jgi:predicted small integral membrane protein
VKANLREIAPEIAMTDPQLSPLLAVGVLLSTALTDAVYVLFTSAVAARRRLAAASLSSCWYLLSAFAVISYTRSWVYVLFAATGSWLGAYASLTWLKGRGGSPPVPLPPHVP